MIAALYAMTTLCVASLVLNMVLAAVALTALRLLRGADEKLYHRRLPAWAQRWMDAVQ